MGLLDIFRPKNKQAINKIATAPSFQSITEYAPVFSTWSGELYEQALTRSAIEKTAVLASKLKPEVLGTAKPRINRAIKTAPNQFMSWPTMIRRLVTVYLTDNTVAVVPSLDSNENIIGLFPLKFDYAEIVEHAGEPWIKFFVGGSDVPLVIELRNVCLLTRFQYESDYFGSDNNALNSTMALIDYQEQAQETAIKNGAKIQFIAAANGSMRPEDIEAKRDNFSEINLSEKNTSGLMIYDNTFDSVKQVEPQSYTVDTAEMERIQDNVFNYFGINEDILQSNYTEEQFGAFYESQIEPFAVQLGEGLSQMFFTPIERTHGNAITFSANRLEYASNASKRNMIRDMLDRRIMTVNEAREILQLPPVPGGDTFIYRGEYISMDMDGTVIYKSGGDIGDDGANVDMNTDDFDLGGDDELYNDSDAYGNGDKDEDN